MPPRVSIVTRTKDRPLFLTRALRSIASQSFADWEVVIVNDGGARAAVDRALADSGIDTSKVAVIDHPTATGRWPAANAGVRATSGEFLILHDDDDSWAPAFLDAAVEYLDAHPDRLGVVSRIQIVWERRVGDDIQPIGEEQFLPNSLAPLLMDQLQFNRFIPIAFLYRRTAHDLVGPYDESVPVVGDWLFNTQILLRGPLDYLGPTPLVFWHQRPSASGVDGNSVIEARDDHALHDALVRDQALRGSIDRDGPGLPLYLTAYVDRRLRETEDIVRTEVARLQHEMTNPLYVAARRMWRRLRNPGGDARQR
ncbi:glycosyltransferase [Microbacterium sp. SSW1-59]|uniref:glycosyltransferase family 2 protein n=1 Tax=Microbacterium xanthum TaxID=3079794 RepID=UPI002AD3C890|nr:glycosyltransferase [Microbacterium sp. SSW1-59]MDZ8201563.1 glycosyltransferase [Microbacterium sp. SSW1-59]